MKILKLALIITTLFFSYQAFAADAKAASSNPIFTVKQAAVPSKPLNYLFVQTAPTAVLKPINAKEGKYSLTLKNVNPFVTYFTDRPNRVAGMMPTEEFMKIWMKPGKNSFSKDAPNADLEGMQLHYMIGDKSVSFVAEVLNPRFDAKKNEVTYDLKAIGAQAHVIDKTMTLSQVALFLDNWCPGCCCG